MMKSLAITIFALLPALAQAAFPLSCWTSRPDTVVTVTGYAGAAARISGTLSLWDAPLGETKLLLSGPKTDASISAVAIACKSPLADVPGVKAVQGEEQMFLETSAKIPAGYQLPVPVWIDEMEPGFRRATIGGKP